jgi:hypothetical protein
MNGQHDAPVPEITPESKQAAIRPPANPDQQVPPAAAAQEQQETTRIPQPTAGWGAPPSAVPSDARPAAGRDTARQSAGWETAPQQAGRDTAPQQAGRDTARQSAGWGGPAASGSFAGGQPGAKTRLWTVKRGLVVAGAAAVLAGGAGVGVYALSSSSAAASGTADGNAMQGTAPGAPGGTQGGFAGGTQAQRGPGNFAPGGLGGMGSGLSAAVHSEYVVLQDGTYATKVEQLGTVTEVATDSVTVKSTDGFTRTYSLGADVAVSNLQQRRQQSGGTSTGQLTVADIVSGAMVRIVAAKDSSGFPAESVQLVAATATGQTN